MVNCERCGVSEENTPDGLYAVVYDGKLVPMCRQCVGFEELLVVKKINTTLEPIRERHQSVYERMVHISGVKRNISDFEKNRSKAKEIQSESKEPTLRELVEKKKLRENSEPPSRMPGVMSHHHWIVMRARRSRKLSQEQLAELINEPVAILVDIERGKIPDKIIVLKKLEDALKIKLFTGPVSEREYIATTVDESDIPLKRGKNGKPLMFDSNVFEEIKIGELKDLDVEKNLETGQDKASYWSNFKKKKEKPVETKEYLEEVILLEEDPEELEEIEKPKERKESFFKKLFSRKKKVESLEEPLEEVAVEEVEEEQKKEPKKSYRERQKQTSGMSKRDLSSREINELIFGKKEAKERKK